MANLFTNGKFQAVGADGLAVPGGLLYTYAAGTLTPLASYTDQGGLSANANPVVCDAAGQADVWIGTSAYRMILKTAAGATVWDVDNIRSVYGDFAATSSAALGAGMVGYSSALAYAGGTVGDALRHPVTQNAVDYATIGTNEKLTNGGFTGASTGWTLSNFTYSANTITHAAGTVGTATQSITLGAYKLYKLSVTLTTTTRGGVDFQFNGTTMLDDTGYYTFDPSTNTYTFPFLSGAATTANFSVVTDASWAGSVDTVSLIEVATEMPLSFTAVPTDDASQRIPYGVKWGRYNAGVIGIGDRQTMAMASVNATWNLVSGARALEGNIDGFENTVYGTFAGRYTLTSRNTFTGYAAGKYNTLGYDLHFDGYKAGSANTTGVRNHADGKHVLMQNTCGNDNWGSGFQALYNVLNTSGNTAGGSQVALNCRGSENTYFGALSGLLNADPSVTYTYNYTTNYGAETKVYGNNGTTLGFQAQVGADGSPVDNSMALGSGVTVRVANAIKIGAATQTLVTPGRVFSYRNSGSDGTAAGITYTVAQFVKNTIFTRSGPGAPFNDTTPTAAAIVAAMPGAEVNNGYVIKVRNTSGFTLTLLNGAGVTLGGNTTVAAGQCRTYEVYATNVGSGTEAVSVIGVETAAI